MYKLIKAIIAFALFTMQLVSCQQGRQQAAKHYVDSIIEANRDVLFSNPSKADSTFRQLQHEVTDSAEWYRLQLYRGTALLRGGNLQQGNQIFNQVEHWCNTHAGNEYLAGLMWNHRGNAQLFIGNSRKAGQCYERAFTLLNHDPKSKDLIAATINLADNYMQAGRMPLAAERYRYALFLTDSLHDNTNRASICCGLGLVYMELENFNEAHKFFNIAARDIAHRSLQTQHFYHFSLGNCFYLQGRYDEALKSFKRALHIGQQLGNNYLTEMCRINLGEVYLMQDSLLQAQQQMQYTRHYLQRNGEMLSPENLFYLKSLLVDLDIAQRKGCKVNDILEPLSDSTQMVRSPRYLMLHYRRLERYAARYAQWQRAYRYQKRAELYADSLHSQQTRNSVADLAGRYQRDTTLLRQQITLSKVSAQSARRQNYLIIAIVSVVALCLAATLIIVAYRRRTHERLKRQMEQMTELRMDIVRNRVSPHYIFNVLGTVLPRLQRYPEMVEPVEMLIDVLRGNLLTSGKVAVPLRDELALVHRFVDLHHYSKGALPVVTWQVQADLQQSDWLVPSMSLQIPVENALKHAFSTLTTESAIHIAITQTDDVLIMQITDNGQGYNPGRVKRTNRDTGTGLRLLTRTFDILNRYNRSNASLLITNIAPPHHGTRVELHIPKGYNFNLKGATNS